MDERHAAFHYAHRSKNCGCAWGKTSVSPQCPRLHNLPLLPTSPCESYFSCGPGRLRPDPVYLKNLAGAEGFEPPSPVLETGSLAVELTPLFKHSAFSN